MSIKTLNQKIKMKWKALNLHFSATVQGFALASFFLKKKFYNTNYLMQQKHNIYCTNSTTLMTLM